MPVAAATTAVVEPNAFTAVVEAEKQSQNLSSAGDFLDAFTTSDAAKAAQQVLERWIAAGHKRRFGPNHVVLEARGPAVAGVRTVVAISTDGRVLVPFGSYAGQNSGIPIDALTTPEFRSGADPLFGFTGAEKQARTAAGWRTPDRAEPLITFASQVAAAYQQALEATNSPG
jgi:hypothetical protein